VIENVRLADELERQGDTVRGATARAEAAKFRAHEKNATAALNAALEQK
jgi:hypothetical protein